MAEMLSRSGKSLKQTVVQKIKDYIIAESLQVGDKLPTERKLAESYQVSRSVVREALSYLENTGVTESVQGRGTLVKAQDITPLIEGFLFSFQVSHGNLKDLMMLRLTFELAAIDIIERKQAPLTSIAESLVDDVQAFNVSADQKFHESILTAVDSSLFQQMSAVVQAYFYQTPIETSHEENVRSMTEHRNIYEALKDGNFSLAKALLTQHLMRGAEFYEKIAFDIGGTYIKSAIIDENRQLQDYDKVRTPVNENDAIINYVEARLQRYIQEHQLQAVAVGISTAGAVDRKARTIAYANPNILNYTGTNFVDKLSAYVQELVVYNDVDAALLGSWMKEKWIMRVRFV
ncbi:ROK family protein [Staphylococcus pseudintermedius]